MTRWSISESSAKRATFYSDPYENFARLNRSHGTTAAYHSISCDNHLGSSSRSIGRRNRSKSPRSSREIRHKGAATCLFTEVSCLECLPTRSDSHGVQGHFLPVTSWSGRNSNFLADISLRTFAGIAPGTSRKTEFHQPMYPSCNPRVFDFLLAPGHQPAILKSS